MAKYKYYRPAQLADIYLDYLAMGGDKGLSTFFNEKKIFLDGDLARDLVGLLLESKLVKELHHSLDMIGFREPVETKSQADHFLDGFSLEFTAGKYEITNKGRAFVSHGQRLDVQTITEFRERRQKWKDRGINFLIAVATAVFIVWLTEPIKKSLSKQDNKQSPKENSNASSPVRPSIDPR